MCRRELVLIRARVHPFPSRTRKLSSLLLTILGWRRPGKIGSANTKTPRRKSRGFVMFCGRTHDSHPTGCGGVIRADRVVCPNDAGQDRAEEGRRGRRPLQSMTVPARRAGCPHPAAQGETDSHASARTGSEWQGNGADRVVRPYDAGRRGQCPLRAVLRGRGHKCFN